MKNEKLQNGTSINILGVEPTPFVRKDGFQEAVLSFRNAKGKLVL